jgi:hypothetical protein
MNFEHALSALREGYAVWREGWNGKGQYLRLQRPDANSVMTLPYIYLTTAQEGYRVPWVASHTDLLMKDWAWDTDSSLGGNYE